jgi:hypothetical protein
MSAWTRDTAPAFVLMLGWECWLGFACQTFAFVMGPRQGVRDWCDTKSDRAWTRYHGRWAIAGRTTR